jgi:hypothetical protein
MDLVPHRQPGLQARRRGLVGLADPRRVLAAEAAEQPVRMRPVLLAVELDVAAEVYSGDSGPSCNKPKTPNHFLNNRQRDRGAHGGRAWSASPSA